MKAHKNLGGVPLGHIHFLSWAIPGIIYWSHVSVIPSRGQATSHNQPYIQATVHSSNDGYYILVTCKCYSL